MDKGIKLKESLRDKIAKLNVGNETIQNKSQQENIYPRNKFNALRFCQSFTPNLLLCKNQLCCQFKHKFQAK